MTTDFNTEEVVIELEKGMRVFRAFEKAHGLVLALKGIQEATAAAEKRHADIMVSLSERREEHN